MVLITSTGKFDCQIYPVIFFRLYRGVLHVGTMKIFALERTCFPIGKESIASAMQNFNTLKDTAEALPVDLLMLNTLRGTKILFCGHGWKFCSPL